MLPNIKVELAKVFAIVGKLAVALVTALLDSILSFDVLIGMNIEFDSVLSVPRKLVLVVDKDVAVVTIGVTILLLDVLVPNLGNELGVTIGGDVTVSVTGLPKVKHGRWDAVVGIEETFCNDSVLVTTGAIDTIFVSSIVLFVVAITFVSFIFGVPIIGMLNCASGAVMLGKLKVVATFVSTFATGGRPLGIMAAVVIGVVLTLVVVVEELRVAQLTEHVAAVTLSMLSTLTSSA